MLDSFRFMVTFTFFSLRANFAGGGKKSFTISTSPMGPLVYFIFFFINPLSFSPIPCAEYPNLILSVGEPYRQNFSIDLPEAVVPYLHFRAMRLIQGDNPILIEENALSILKGYSVLFLIRLVFRFIPFNGLHLSYCTYFYMYSKESIQFLFPGIRSQLVLIFRKNHVMTGLSQNLCRLGINRMTLYKIERGEPGGLCNSFSVKVLIGLDGGGFSWHGQVDSTDHPLFMDRLQHRRHQPQA